jgi:hypothetical protein
MTGYACTGPVDHFDRGHALTVIRDVLTNWVGKALPEPTLFRSGCAPGIDSLFILEACDIWPLVPRELVVPYAPYNISLLKTFIDDPLTTITALDPVGGGPAAEYMNRNDRIATPPTKLLLAFPHTDQEEQRSGTWATIRRARARKPRMVLIMPIGRTQTP